ncbi:hypothetical protein AAHA92_00090 [Salvia divinorum]|uniref:Uncharacterized protein n=1 Tax=Salvia divinorum TaxID=28513 RepID=A0ABD1IJ34_SALDI
MSYSRKRSNFEGSISSQHPLQQRYLLNLLIIWFTSSNYLHTAVLKIIVNLYPRNLDYFCIIQMHVIGKHSLGGIWICVLHNKISWMLFIS